MKPGKYYVGDLMYVCTDEEYECIEKLVSRGQFGEAALENGIPIVLLPADKTNGKPGYNSNFGPVSVDSGAIGAIPLDYIAPDGDIEWLKSNGCVVTQHQEWTPVEDDDFFHFGIVCINKFEEKEEDYDHNDYRRY